jgi:hypothetical protein
MDNFKENINKEPEQKPRRGRPPKSKNKSNEVKEIDENRNNILSRDNLFSSINNNDIRFPDKIKREKLIDYDNFSEDDDIRPPDEIKREKLIDYDNLNEYDDEIMQIIELSRMEYYNSIKNYEHNESEREFSNINNKLEEEVNNSLLFNNKFIDDSNIYNSFNINKNINDKTNIKESIIQESNNIDESIIKESNNIKESNIMQESDNIDESIINESKRIEIEKRQNSLPNFIKMIKKINSIYFTVRENEIKFFIEDKLNDYFNLIIDKIIIEDENLYKDLYLIIDSYYIIPKNKNYKKFAIPFDEDQLLRTIFIK